MKKPITFLTSIATVSISLMLAPAYAHHAGWAHHSGGGGGGSGFHASGGGHGGFDPWQLHGFDPGPFHSGSGFHPGPFHPGSGFHPGSFQ
jgi:hypothetical protein